MASRYMNALEKLSNANQRFVSRSKNNQRVLDLLDKNATWRREAHTNRHRHSHFEHTCNRRYLQMYYTLCLVRYLCT